MYSALVQRLQDVGVDKIFGVPGGGENLAFLEAADSAGMEFVLSHDEATACIMAGTYGRLQGVPGVAVVTRGPGLTNALTGLAQATLDRHPLVLISDTVPARKRASTPHQALDQEGATRPLTKLTATLTSHNVAKLASAALAIANTYPFGAVHLDVDPQGSAEVDAAPTRPSAGHLSDLHEVLALVRASKRTVVIVGDEARQIWDGKTHRLATTVPVLCTYQAQAVAVAADSTYEIFTGAASEMHWLEQADLVLTIGLDPVELVPGQWPAGLQVVHLASSMDVYADAWPEAHVTVTATYSQMKALASEPLQEWQPAAPHPAQTLKDRVEESSPRRPFGTSSVVMSLRREHPEAMLTVDAGAHMLPAVPLWRARRPDTLWISNGLATMGFALPAAIGCALARPDERIVCLTGDGGLGMVLAELETVARLDLNIAVLVLNDALLSLINLKRKKPHDPNHMVTYSMTDFSAVAKGMGLDAYRVESDEELRSALQAWNRGPILIDAKIDPTEYLDLYPLLRG